MNTIKKLKEKETAKVVKGEAPVVVQIIETCNGNLHLDGGKSLKIKQIYLDVDSLDVQGELVTTVFEEQAQSASLQVGIHINHKLAPGLFSVDIIRYSMILCGNLVPI